MNVQPPPTVPQEIADRLEKIGILAVLVIDNVKDAVPLVDALRDGGIGGIELTLRTDVAFECLRVIREADPDLLAGVGTILTPSQVQLALQSGASFGVAPGYNGSVVAAAAEAGLPFAPGVATASEIEGAVSQGCRILKYFHAGGMGGLDYLRGVNAPYKHLGLRYIPLGGVGPKNLRHYLESDEVIAIGGTWIAPRELVQSNDWRKISDNAREAMKIFREVRGDRVCI